MPVRDPAAPVAPGIHGSPRLVLVVDDHVAFAEALAYRLDAEPEVKAVAAASIEQARGILSRDRVDVMLIDADIGGYDGIRFANEVLSEKPDVRIVVVTGGGEEDQVVEAVRAGVRGWVPKNEPVERLLAVVRGSLCGETWIPPRLLTDVLAELISGQSGNVEDDLRLRTLTPREAEILACLVAGASADAIAGQLYVSKNTVRTHIQNILRKLDVHSVLAAVAMARRADADLLGPRSAHAERRRPRVRLSVYSGRHVKT